MELFDSNITRIYLSVQLLCAMSHATAAAAAAAIPVLRLGSFQHSRVRLEFAS